MGRRELAPLYVRYAPDLLRDPFLLRLEQSYIGWHLGLALLLLGAGWAAGGLSLGLSWLAYGFALRTVFVLHATWLVNSAAHCWGYRTYDTGDNSRNNAAVALVSLGEGWHNNHHHSPVAANHGHRWWEVDLSFLTILACAALTRLCGQTWVRDVKVYARGRLATWFRSAA
jgi:stearoyl-CoA desaturase (delta-9 desaturase)